MANYVNIFKSGRKRWKGDNTKAEKKKRANRGKARYWVAKKLGKGNVEKGLAMLKNKDIDHKDHNTFNNNMNNLRIMDSNKNRSKNGRKRTMIA